MKLFSSILLFAAAPVSFSTRLRGVSTVTSIDFEHTKRELATYYYSTSDAPILGQANPDAAMANPLKGLLTSPRFTGGNTPNSVPSTLEFYYIGFDEIATGSGKFNWTVLDATLANAASRNNHVIWRVFCHYPGQPLRVPQYLIAAGIKLVPIANGSVSPQYDDPILLEAFRQFIVALGLRYDGHKSLGFIQLGLLGGEWHTYPDNNLLSTATKDKVVGWYDAAFKTTQMQVRNPLASAYAAGMGRHDDSFAYSTLGPVNWFFMPSVVAAGQASFWQKGAMGGETRPELQGTIFESSYQPGSDQYKQDFMECVNVTHATYMIHHNAFQGGLSGTELENARRAHARMGYNFQVTSVGVASSSTGTVSVDVTVKQTGVAPFYYPLSLVLSCPGTTATLSGVEGLIENGASKVFSFQNIPANATCLGNTQILLKSAFVYAGRPLKFAQGSDGKVLLKLPLPGISNPVAVPSPVAAPVPSPVKAPLPSPVVAPVPPPVKAPFSAPVAAPVPSPAMSPEAFFAGARTPQNGSRFNISGTTSVHSSDVTIAGMAGYLGELFRHHRWASSRFTYTISGFTKRSSHNLTMGFAETFTANCVGRKRLFNVSANEATLISTLDVFTLAGCNKAYLTTHTVTADTNGIIALRFATVVQSPFISFISIVPM